MPLAYKDYYKILGLEKSADAKAIKQAYRRLARKYHPDQNKGDARATERFREIAEANEVLADPEKRRRYDTLGPDWQQHVQGAPGGRDFGGFRVHVDPGAGDLGDFSEFFRTIFGDLGVRGGGGAAEFRDFELGGGSRRGPGGRRAGWARRGDDLQTPVAISLEEAFHGTRRTLELERPAPCASCGGGGVQGSTVCAACRGLGEIRQPQRIDVKIPPGVREGSRVRVAGEGGSGGAGGARGDLYLQIALASHPTFERRGDDIDLELPIAPWEAALGAEVEVPTLRGKVTMRVPPETSSGKTFRLPGYGVPHLRGEGRGDQYVRVRVVVPSGLSAPERELYEELRRLRPAPPRESR